MARIRTIKPEFWEDEKLSELPIQARLLFIGTWNFADDCGVISDSIKWLKAKIFPYDTLRDNEVKQWCDSLVKNRMLVPFAYGGKGYYIIRRFRSHQIIDKRYSKEILPPEVLAEILSKIDDEETTTLPQCDNSVTTPQERKGNGKGNGKEGNNARDAPDDALKISLPFDSENFSRQWALWKDYKARDHKFKFKSPQSEQAALSELVKLAKGEEQTAIAIIHQSMANGWKGFFELKNFQQNGTGKTQRTGGEVSDFDLAAKIAQHYSTAGDT